MAWTVPYTWTTGHLVTAAELNAQLKDNMRYLKGLDGVPTVESGLVIDNTGGDEYLLLPLLSTAETGTVLNAEGEVAFDEQTHHPKFYDGTAVRSVASEANITTHANLTTAHGAVSAATASRIVIRDGSARAKFAAPNASGDALIKGTRHTTAEMPAVTDEYYLVGTGTNMEERAVPGGATKEFFVDVRGVFSSGSASIIGDFHRYRLAAGQYIYWVFKCPHDFITLTSIKVIGIKSTNGTIDWTVISDFAAVGEAYNTHSDTDTADGLAMTDTEIEEVDISAAFTGLVADDYVGFKFTLDAISAGNFDVIGFTFKYS